MIKLFKKKYFWNYVVGSVSLAHGVYIIITGEVGRLVSAGEGRYWVGGVFVAFGLYAILASYFAKKQKNQKREPKTKNEDSR